MLEFTLSGFIFAIINFLILVALLYKFLHKPLLAVLEKRRVAIETAQSEAKAQSDKAAALSAEYEQKLDAIEEERDKLLSEAKQRADSARDELLTKARGEAEREAANLKQDWARQERDAVDALQDRIVQTSLDLTSRILSELGDTDLEASLQKQLLAKLEDLAGKADGDLFAGDAPVRVVSAKALSDADRAAISERVDALANGSKAKLEFSEDATLVAGARIEFVSTAINANLADVVQSVREQMSAAATTTEADTTEKTENG